MPRNSALYIEGAALEYPHGAALFERFADRPRITIDSYKEVFARPGQDIRGQKGRPALVAAVGSPPFIYDAPVHVAGPGDLPVRYNAQLRNCVYDCDYCFLQGMHPSGHTLVFVNSADFHRAAVARAREGDYWLSISYLSDILGFERILPLASEWIELARGTPGITLEIRTKGDAHLVPSVDPPSNVVLVWTLSPAQIARRYERGTAGFEHRLQAVATAAERGWRVRLAFDPVVLVPRWGQAYREMLARVEADVPDAAVEAATYGVFRMGADYARRITTARTDSRILHHPFVRSGGLVTYSEQEIGAVHRVVGEPLRRWLGSNRVAFVHD